MVDPIEIPDLSSKPIANKKLKAVVKSNPEKEEEGFSHALKEKMEEDLHEKGKHAREDSFEKSQDESEKEDNQELEQQKTTKSPVNTDEQENDDNVTTPDKGHIDLKA